MLFSYKPSNKKLIGLGLSVLIHLALFVAFYFYFTNLLWLGLLFLATSIMNFVFFIYKLAQRAHFDFYENEIKVESNNESKTLSMLNLLFVHSFDTHKNGKEITHLVTSEGEYTFSDKEDPNYLNVKEYLQERVQESEIAKYYYHLHLIKQRVPGMIVSLLFLIAYLYYFQELNFDSVFFKFILIFQGATLILYVGQWIYYRKKISTMSAIQAP